VSVMPLQNLVMGMTCFDSDVNSKTRNFFEKRLGVFENLDSIPNVVRFACNLANNWPLTRRSRRQVCLRCCQNVLALAASAPNAVSEDRFRRFSHSIPLEKVAFIVTRTVGTPLTSPILLLTATASGYKTRVFLFHDSVKVARPRDVIAELKKASMPREGNSASALDLRARPLQ
jgi:hypothetical protein